MIAKIGRGANIIGALSYNQLKVEKENGQVLATNRIMETPDGSLSVAHLYRSFEPYLIANKRTEKPVLHISLNPNPGDKVTDENFKQIAKDYMEQMNYGDQPYIVFKHTDIERSHIHIVSTCVDRYGKKITDTYEKLRSMDACRALEQKYNLMPATEKHHTGNEQIFRPVDYKAGDVKSQIASVVRYLPKCYQYQSFGAYNALLSLFNITAEEVNGELHGQPKQGIVYFALNEQGEKSSNPFKASLFGKLAGHSQLQNHFEKSKETLNSDVSKSILKNTVEVAINTLQNEKEFKKNLLEQGINTVVRRNKEGRIYGMTFIDHESRTVWNGSQLGREFSANAFNDRWNNGSKLEMETKENVHFQKQEILAENENTLQPHNLFDFLKTEPGSNNEREFIERFGSLLPGDPGEDYEEMDFANKMKRKKKRIKRKS